MQLEKRMFYREEKEVTEHSHLLMFSMSPCSVMMFRSPSISSRALWYLCAQSSLWWNISSRAADCTCRQQPHAKRLLPDQTQLSLSYMDTSLPPEAAHSIMSESICFTPAGTVHAWHSPCANPVPGHGVVSTICTA